MDETPLWWSMASKQTLRRRGQKIITEKSSGHDKIICSVVLAISAIDYGRKLVPKFIFKHLNNVVPSYQRRAPPDEREPHNLNQDLARRDLQISRDVDSDDENAMLWKS